MKKGLLELLEDKLRWQCTPEDQEISFENVIENFQNFFKHDDRCALPYLLVVDNIGWSENISEISKLESVTNKVPKLQIILPLTKLNVFTI